MDAFVFHRHISVGKYRLFTGQESSTGKTCGQRFFLLFGPTYAGKFPCGQTAKDAQTETLDVQANLKAQGDPCSLTFFSRRRGS